MIIVPVKDGENIERALKKFKRKFEKTGVVIASGVISQSGNRRSAKGSTLRWWMAAIIPAAVSPPFRNASKALRRGSRFFCLSCGVLWCQASAATVTTRWENGGSNSPSFRR